MLEIGFNTLSAATALFVVATALRVASSFTLSAHRRAMQVLAAASLVVVASEVVGVGAALTRPSTLTDAAGEFAEFVAVAAGAAVLHYLYRVEREEIQPLRRSANVDDFKAYNDAHGHDAGDDILRGVAKIIRESARADDLIGRYGGEEFVLLVNDDTEGALEVAERIREAVRRDCVPATGNPLDIRSRFPWGWSRSLKRPGAWSASSRWPTRRCTGRRRRARTGCRSSNRPSRRTSRLGATTTTMSGKRLS